MNIYPPIIKFNGDKISYIDVTNEWVLANKEPEIVLTTDKTHIVANDPVEEFATITIQLTTPKLIDGRVENLTDNRTVNIMIEGNTEIVELVNGVGSIEVGSLVPKTIKIEPILLNGNIITIESI